MLYMQNGKAANARYVGPMTEAVAQELRAELARQRRSAKSLAEDNGLNRSTLHKTLNAQRAIDVDDLLRLSDMLNISATDLFARAERIARDTLPDVFIAEDSSSEDSSAEPPTPSKLGKLVEGRFRNVDVPAQEETPLPRVAKKASRDPGGDEGDF